jgi:hypothetical protein
MGRVVSWLYANVREMQYKHHSAVIQHMTSCVLHNEEVIQHRR